MKGRVEQHRYEAKSDKGQGHDDHLPELGLSDGTGQSSQPAARFFECGRQPEPGPADESGQGSRPPVCLPERGCLPGPGLTGETGQS
jgi:hypothetical protein